MAKVLRKVPEYDGNWKGFPLGLFRMKYQLNIYFNYY